jgi:hypothetical protein
MRCRCVVARDKVVLKARCKAPSREGAVCIVFRLNSHKIPIISLPGGGPLLLFLLLVDPILHIMQHELQHSIKNRRLPAGAKQWSSHDADTGDAFRFSASEGGVSVEVDGSGEFDHIEFDVERVRWDGYAVGAKGAGYLFFNDNDCIEVQTTDLSGLGTVRRLCDAAGIEHNIGGSVPYREFTPQDHPGFLGAYAVKPPPLGVPNRDGKGKGNKNSLIKGGVVLMTLCWLIAVLDSCGIWWGR